MDNTFYRRLLVPGQEPAEESLKVLKWIRDVTPELVKAFTPSEIILFGSRRAETNRLGIGPKPTPDSDIDLLVVMRTSLSFLDRLKTVHDFLLKRDPPRDVDVIVYTPKQWKSKETSSFGKMMADGLVLYRKEGDQS